MSEAKSSTKKHEFESTRKFPKKSTLYSSEDLAQMADKSSRARLIKQVVGPDEMFRYSFEKHHSESPNHTQPHENEVTECKEYVTGITAYPSRVGLRWNPCVEMSSGEDFPIQLEPEKSKSCNCAHCSSSHCPSKKSSGFKTGFRDNIMTFSDKTTMTPKLNHAGCSARTPSVSPRPSSMSMTESQASIRCNTAYFSPPPPPPPPKPIFKKPKGVLRSNYYDYEPCCDEAVRDTDMTEDCPFLKRSYSRHCISHHPDYRESAKRNIYNEGISDNVAQRYPVTPAKCPHRALFGTRSFCGNVCPNCSCAPPAPRGSRYHQQCKHAEYKGPVYYDYDMDPEEVQQFVAIPRVVIDRYVAPAGRACRAPSIILPRKVLTSNRDIDTFVQEEKAKLPFRHKPGR